jgi:hypothetical protein
MSTASDDRDVDDVLREERSRGRRPVNMATRRQREADKRALRWLLQNGTEAELRAAIRALGYADDSPTVQRAWEAWRRVRPGLAHGGRPRETRGGARPGRGPEAPPTGR